MIQNNDTSKLEVIRSYTSLFEADVDKGLLESNGIQAAINNQQIGSIFPGLDMITLSVDHKEAQKAIEILEKESDKKH